MEDAMAARGTMTQVHFVSRRSSRAVLRQAWATLMEMRRAHRTRRMLAEMDDRLLSDIGIGRGDALMEASRAPWDISRGDTSRR